MNKNKFILAVIILLFLVVTIVSIFINVNNNKKWIQLGDEVAIFNSIDENGKEIKSVVAIYNSEFTHKKLVVELDAIFYSIDQLYRPNGKKNDNEVKFRAYNDKSYQDITLNFKDKSIEKSNVVNEKYNGDEKVEINVYANGKFELVKPDSYMLIKDPNLMINGQYYTFSDNKL